MHKNGRAYLCVLVLSLLIGPLVPQADTQAQQHPMPAASDARRADSIAVQDAAPAPQTGQPVSPLLWWVGGTLIVLLVLTSLMAMALI